MASIPAPTRLRMESPDAEETKPFRLLDLPDELWVRIGKFAIDSAPTLTQHALGCDPTFLSNHDRDARTQPPITGVCRTLRTELLPYYYSTKIDIYLDCTLLSDVIEFKPVGRWLEKIGERNRGYVREIRVDTNADITAYELDKCFGVDGMGAIWTKDGEIDHGLFETWTWSLKFAKK